MTDLLKFSGYSLEPEGTKKKVQPRKYLDMTKFCPSPRMAGICLSPCLDLGSVSPRPPRTTMTKLFIVIVLGESLGARVMMHVITRITVVLSASITSGLLYYADTWHATASGSPEYFFPQSALVVPCIGYH